MGRVTFWIKRPGDLICAVFGLAFALCIVISLAWGSYLTYYGGVTNGIRGLNNVLGKRVEMHMAADRLFKGSLSNAITSASVSECVGSSLHMENAFGALRSLAGWHGWREFTDRDLDASARSIVADCFDGMPVISVSDSPDQQNADWQLAQSQQ
jgi:hypothetical protein